MKFRRTVLALAPLCFLLASMDQESIAQSLRTVQSRRIGEPSWYPYVVARGPDRAVIENTPIEARPYRPLHFYGNAVRRNFYRGNPAALPRDYVRATSVLIRRR